ncbi:MAG: response regulator [Candidatus Glassbacteria bacterium]|nr:response regulator [Candidatus Glassbacteria bacterium]
MSEENVLLIDSELLTRDLLGNHFKHMGFKVFAVDNSSAALKLIPQSRFHLAVISEKVGDKSLQEIVSCLRTHDADSLVFLVTSRARDAGYLESRCLYESIVKPFRLEEVSVKFHHAVENISLRRALRASVDQVRKLKSELAAYGDAAEEVAIPELAELKAEGAGNGREGTDTVSSPGKDNMVESDSEDDVFEKIRKLDVLRNAGILTSGEFNRKKKELLDRI